MCSTSISTTDKECEVFCAQVVQNIGKKTNGLSFLRLFTCRPLYTIAQFQKINCVSWCSLILSSNWRNLQKIKTSLCSILNSSLTDVFGFCKLRRSEENKRVQVGWSNWSIEWQFFMCFTLRTPNVSF